MAGRWAWLSLVGMAVACGAARAQGTAVQLPTSSYFTTNSTVSVPDRGSALLGGIGRTAAGANEFGVPLLPFRLGYAEQSARPTPRRPLEDVVR